MEIIEAWAAAVQQVLGWLRALAAALAGLAGVVQQFRSLGHVFGSRAPADPPGPAYETRWLTLVLELKDAQGRRAVLSRRQCIRVLAADGVVVRELVWGDGEQLLRYRTHGARRMRVRREGSKRAVLLDPDHRSAAGDQLIIASQRTLQDAFRRRDEYCEALLERPTDRLEISVHFPATRPPREACLVLAASEKVLRALRPRYGADGRARLHCRVKQPVTGVVYSVRWTW